MWMRLSDLRPSVAELRDLLCELELEACVFGSASSPVAIDSDDNPPVAAMAAAAGEDEANADVDDDDVAVRLLPAMPHAWIAEVERLNAERASRRAADGGDAPATMVYRDPYMAMPQYAPGPVMGGPAAAAAHGALYQRYRYPQRYVALDQQ
jgi:hypothetical protein